ncbi:MAG: hypothetical protein ABI165_20005, partial [Bryobacteraceae bacterium]
MRINYKPYAAGAAILLVIGYVGVARKAGGQTAPSPMNRSSMESVEAVNLLFGVKDGKPANWDGSVTLSAGTIEKIEGYHFTVDAKISGANAWECSSHPWPPPQAGMHPRERPVPHATMMVPIGVTVYYRAPAGAKMQVKLNGRPEFWFRPSELPEVEAIYPLVDHSVEVRRSPVAQQITDA